MHAGNGTLTRPRRCCRMPCAGRAYPGRAISRSAPGHSVDSIRTHAIACQAALQVRRWGSPDATDRRPDGRSRHARSEELEFWYRALRPREAGTPVSVLRIAGPGVDDILHADGSYVAEQVARDNNLITSRLPSEV